MNRRTLLGITTFLFAFSTLTLPASAKPNFSGKWKLVADKSDFGPMPPPDKLEQTNEHTDPDLKVTSTQAGQQGEMTAELKYSTDGKPTTNTLRGNEVKSVAKWDGDALSIESKLDFQGNEVTLSDKWSLSEDGKSLTINRKINSPQGEFEVKIVLAKQ
jgi:hypothetical protein